MMVAASVLESIFKSRFNFSGEDEDAFFFREEFAGSLPRFLPRRCLVGGAKLWAHPLQSECRERGERGDGDEAQHERAG